MREGEKVKLLSQGTPVYRDCHGICILPIHFEIQFLLSISSFFDFYDFTAQYMSKISCVPNLSLKYQFWGKVITKNNFPILSMFSSSSSSSPSC